jgi:shikimate kinase
MIELMSTFEVMRVYLVGYMGSGKSRTGREAAERMKCRFIDLDDVFEERYRISVLDFFDKYGETMFRNIERNLLHDTIHEDNVIIATGGGTPCFFDNMDFINRNGTSIYIKPGNDSLVRRLMIVRKKRPLLKDVSKEKLADFIFQQLTERELFYSRAHYKIEGPDISAEGIIRLISDLRSAISDQR